MSGGASAGERGTESDGARLQRLADARAQAAIAGDDGSALDESAAPLTLTALTGGGQGALTAKVVGSPLRRVSWSPQPRFLVLFALLTIPVLLAPHDGAAIGWMTLGGGALLLMAALEAAVLWRLTPSITIERIHDQRLSLGEDNPVRLHVRSTAGLPLAGQIADDTPHGFQPPDVRSDIQLPHRGSTEVRYVTRPHRRGDHRFASAWLRLSTGLGLAAIRLEVPLVETVPVFPNLRALQRYRLLARHRIDPSGLHRIRGTGSGGEFDRLRDYSIDDTYRDIHWKATARRDAPVVRVNRPERGQQILMAIDSGRAMAPRIGHGPRQPTGIGLPGLQTRHDLALSSALLLADVALTQSDQVGLCLFGHRVHNYYPPRRDPGTLSRFLGLLYAAHAEYTATDHAALARWLTVRLRRRSLIVLWTDLADESTGDSLLRAASILQQRHLVLVVALRDRTLEAMAEQRTDEPRALYHRAVAQDLLARRAAQVSRMRLAGVRVLESSAEAMSLEVIDQYLDVKLRGLL